MTSDATTTPSAGVSAAERGGAMAGRLALLVVCLGVFLSALDQTVVVTALPSIIREIDVPLTRIDRAGWIVSGYLLGYVIALPLMGRVADAYGRRLVFILALTLFALGSLFCALAPALVSPIAPDPTTLDGALLTPLYAGVQWLLEQLGRLGVDVSLPALNVLVGARFVQAVGGGALVPVAMAVTSDLFGPSRRALALGLVGGVAEAGGALGPLWGAAITTAWGWQWIFLINIPLAALLIVAGIFTLPRLRRRVGRIDLAGALLFGVVLTCLSLGFGPQSGDFNALQPGGAEIAPNVWLLVAAAGATLLFVGVEAFVRAPVIAVRRFRRPAYGAAGALSFFVGVALIVALVLIPTFFYSFQSESGVFGGGLALLRMTALIPVGAVLGGWLANRFGCPPPAILGALCTAVGLFLMSQWPANVGATQVTVATVIAGLGFGLSIAPISASALNAGGAGEEGAAAAMVTVLRMTGMIIGLSWLTLWGVARFKTLLAEVNLAQNGADAALGALRQVYGELFLIAAALALLSVIPALLLWRRPRAGTLAEAEPIASYAAL